MVDLLDGRWGPLEAIWGRACPRGPFEVSRGPFLGTLRVVWPLRKIEFAVAVVLGAGGLRLLVSSSASCDHDSPALAAAPPAITTLTSSQKDLDVPRKDLGGPA